MKKKTLCQTTSESCVEKLVEFVMHLRRLQITHKFEKTRAYHGRNYAFKLNY